MDLVVVRHSVTNNGLPNTDWFSFQSNTVKVSRIWERTNFCIHMLVCRRTGIKMYELCGCLAKERAVDIDSFMHCFLYDLLATIGHTGRKYTFVPVIIH
jgi:hypothetical protein